MSKKVAVWGRFDKLHNGHIDFLREAKKLGDKLYVIIIPGNMYNENYEKKPMNSSEVRKNNVLSLDFVTDVYIDCLTTGLESIINLKPEIIAFGHDQKTQWEKKLKIFLEKKGLTPEYIRLSVYNKGRHGSDL